MPQITSLSPELVEIILSFNKNNEINTLRLTCKHFLNLINESEKLGKFYTSNINICKTCSKLKIHPIVMNLSTGHCSNKKEEFCLCSKTCCNEFRCSYPRCFFCLNTIATKEFQGNLFCSEECQEKASNGIKRERFISSNYF